MNTRPLLSQEVVEYIVDYIHDDTAALFSCSSASFGLLSASRYHLFSDLILDCSRFPSFVGLLEGRWNSIADFVRSLTVTNQRCTGIRSEQYRQPKADQLAGTQLSGIISLFFASLRISDIPEPFWCFITNLKRIGRLSLHQVTIDEPRSFWQYVSTGVPFLKTLDMSGSVYHLTSCPSTPVSYARLSAPVIMPQVSIRNDSQHGLLEWLNAQEPSRLIIPSFSMGLSRASTHAAEDFARFIEKFGPGLQSLEIEIPVGDPEISWLFGINFSSCRSLRTLHLGGLRIGHAGQWQSRTLTSHLLRFFQKQVLSSPFLTEIKLSAEVHLDKPAASFFGISNHILVRAYSWGSIPQILEETNCVNTIKTLMVRIHGHPDLQRSLTEKHVREKVFKGFHARGKLGVDFG